MVPSPLGPGVSMRAYHQLVAIAQTYSVHLILCLPCSNNAEIPASLYGFCHDIEIMPRYKYSGLRGRIWQRWLRFRGDILAGELAYTDHIYKTRAWSRPTSFDRIHIHRLCLSPLVENLLRHFPLSFVSLDMDDLESNTRLSIGHLYKCAGERGRAYSLLREARQYRCLENYIIPKVNKIFVASETDKSILEKRFPNIQFATQLNVTRIPQKNSRQKAGPEAFLSFLFVGTLSYFPNVDALRYFASELAPALDSLGVKWRLRVVGALSQRLRMQLPRGDWRWTWVGWRENLESEYAISNVVIAPIRGGGGTRIKVLEAFAHQVPVVATSLAVEGLSIEHGVHCLVADTPPAFAQACANLKQNPALAEYLVIQAYEFVHSRFTPNILDTLLREERAC